MKKKYAAEEIKELLRECGKVTLSLSDDGNFILDNDDIYIDGIKNAVISNGYVRNTKLHRRWVMSQMFRLLYSDKGYTATIQEDIPYEYSFKQTLEELRVISILEKEDKASFMERSKFFTKDVVVEMCEDYLRKLKKELSGKTIKKCKGIDYIVIDGRNVFCTDIEKKVYCKVEEGIHRIRSARNYSELYSSLRQLYKYNYFKISKKTKKASAWLDAYKGAGSFYTIKNMLMYHDVYILNDKNVKLYESNGLSYLNEVAEENIGEGWRMFGLMKEIINYNNFTFSLNK